MSMFDHIKQHHQLNWVLLRRSLVTQEVVHQTQCVTYLTSTRILFAITLH
jgi:hypothetical protein